MNLKILLPHQIFTEQQDVLSIVAETKDGSFGILPRRLDCVAALCPGILIYESADKGEVYVAVDEGVLVKTGTTVLVSVRQAISGNELSRLREEVDRQFIRLDEREKNMRTVMTKLESGILRRFVDFEHER